MKKNKSSKIIFCFILIFIILLLICVYMLYTILKTEEPKIKTEVQTSVLVQTAPKTIKDVIEKHESMYIEHSNTSIYVEFKNDLYDTEGNSNEQYFEGIIYDLAELEELYEKTFYLYDNEKNIVIKAEYIKETKKYIISYNNIVDFFEKTKGKNYSEVEKVEIIDKVKLTPTSDELSALVYRNMFFKAIKNTIGEGIDLGNGYISYKDGSILIKMSNYRVKTIIFTDKYTTSVLGGIKVGTDLEEIQNKYEGKYGGSIEEGYIMYRTEDVYAFFYKDEIVVYGYSYFYNELFEKSLEQYLNDKDLKTFVETVTKKWNNYEKCEYDFETQSAYITYPSRGVEINIKNNDPTGIKLYKNYYFTNITKQFVKDGKISLNYEEDYIEIIEKQRKQNIGE